MTRLSSFRAPTSVDDARLVVHCRALPLRRRPDLSSRTCARVGSEGLVVVPMAPSEGLFREGPVAVGPSKGGPPRAAGRMTPLRFRDWITVPGPSEAESSEPDIGGPDFTCSAGPVTPTFPRASWAD